MPANTLYNPERLTDLQNSLLVGAARGVSAVCSADGVTNLDLVLTDDVLMTGLCFIVSGATLGDYVSLQVLDPNNNVVAQPVSKWYVPANDSQDFNMVFPVKALARFTLRAVYCATALDLTPILAVNYKLWKVLQ